MMNSGFAYPASYLLADTPDDLLNLHSGIPPLTFSQKLMMNSDFAYPASYLLADTPDDLLTLHSGIPPLTFSLINL